MRVQFDFSRTRKQLPGSGVPLCDEIDAGLVTIQAIGDAYALHCYESWELDPDDSGVWRRSPRPISDWRFDASDEQCRNFPAEVWPEVPHADPIGSCPACMAGRAGSVRTVGLSPASVEKRLSDGPEIAKARWTKFKRRQTYHEQKTWPVDTGDVLTTRELAAAAHAELRRSRCRSKVVTMERRLPAAGVIIERCQVPMRCGLRRCEDCLKLKKLAAAPRMIGPWEQFVTMTIPHDRCSRLHAHRHAADWMTELGERLQARARGGRKQCTAWRCRDRAPHWEMEVDGGRLDYAWVVEDHKDGFPHWHLVWSAKYVCFDSLREIWHDITGMGECHIFVEPVSGAEGISRYLIKYLNKEEFAPDVLACAYRRRLWATTIKKAESYQQGYRVIGFQRFKESAIASERPKFPTCASGGRAAADQSEWTLIQHVEGYSTRWEWSDFTKYKQIVAESQGYGQTTSARVDCPSSSWSEGRKEYERERSRKYLTPDYRDLDSLERSWDVQRVHQESDSVFVR